MEVDFTGLWVHNGEDNKYWYLAMVQTRAVAARETKSGTNAAHQKKQNCMITQQPASTRTTDKTEPEVSSKREWSNNLTLTTVGKLTLKCEQ